ncbi:hypothetical protein EDI_252350 [Entamoeba dispar SAW760]|uniref:Uncharacterized protein n=1 Tax=Entamoeba dispar (strain ATCC PRA-260 / SAW760) TaxID=370354 RepID=B0EF50_ENTDS|nr:uncharacterized protein EDI_252350 [Entamoeba dispar SAW760]EDR26780.1 hypothetical protein EDI_252350 [Entamoeba dispar SAW760]|eukprot:EDR26780.1 hypothetical protein EDI_252350 [Entamoeba dispar SAW760]
MQQIQLSEQQIRKFIETSKGLSETTFKTWLTAKLSNFQEEMKKLILALVSEQQKYKNHIEIKDGENIANTIISIWNSCISLIDIISHEKTLTMMLQIIYNCMKHPIFTMFQECIVTKAIKRKCIDDCFGIFSKYKRLCIHTIQCIERIFKRIYDEKVIMIESNKVVMKLCGWIIGRACLVLPSLYLGLMKNIEIPDGGIRIIDSFPNKMIERVLPEEYQIAIPNDNLDINEFLRYYSMNDFIVCITKGFILGALENDKIEQLLNESVEYQCLLSKYFKIHGESIRYQQGYSLNKFLFSVDSTLLNQIFSMIVTNTNYLNYQSVIKMANTFNKYINLITQHHDLFNPLTRLPFDSKLLINAFHISKLGDNSYALIKLIDTVYYSIQTFPTESRVPIITYLINDSFYFFFTHWSDIVRQHFHYFILYRSTLCWIKDIYNNKLTKQETELYQSRTIKKYNPLDEDMKLILKVRENSHLLEKTKDTFPLKERIIIEHSTHDFRSLSKESIQWTTSRRKLTEVPNVEFPFKDFSISNLN